MLHQREVASRHFHLSQPLRRDQLLSMLMVNGYCLALNLVFVLAGTDLHNYKAIPTIYGVYQHGMWL